MEQTIRKLLPEIAWINSADLQDKVVATYADALTVGGWKPEDMSTIPFTLLIPNCPISYLDHVRGMTRMTKAAMDEFHAIFAAKDPKYTLDNDEVIAGALLHDVGKLAEYEKLPDGQTVKSQLGKDLRHPFSGSIFAMRNGCSSRIAHIIANHAHEGDGTLRSPAGVLIARSDAISFEVIKSFLGMK